MPKNWPVKNFEEGVYLSEAPPLLGFSLEWVNFESGQNQSVKLLQNMVSKLQHNSTPPTPFPATHSLYILFFDFGKGRKPERRLEGQQFKKLGRKYHATWLTVSPVYKLY